MRGVEIKGERERGKGRERKRERKRNPGIPKVRHSSKEGKALCRG